jgi:hypothetical protein
MEPNREADITLLKFLQEIKPKFEKWQKAKINEAQTKEWLIRPFLESIGWQFSNSNEVIPETDDNAGRHPDYGFYLDGKILFYLEAKAISNSLTDMKMIGEKLAYCHNNNVPYLVLTNGKLYKIYYKDIKAKNEEKILLEFDLNELDFNQKADREKILILSRESFKKNQLSYLARDKEITSMVFKAIRKIFEDIPSEFENLINKALRSIVNYGLSSQDIKDSIRRIELSISTEDLSFQELEEGEDEIEEEGEGEEKEKISNKPKITPVYDLNYYQNQYNPQAALSFWNLGKFFEDWIKSKNIPLIRKNNKFYIGFSVRYPQKKKDRLIFGILWGGTVTYRILFRLPNKIKDLPNSIPGLTLWKYEEKFNNGLYDIEPEKLDLDQMKSIIYQLIEFYQKK